MLKIHTTHTHKAIWGSSGWPGAMPSSLAKQVAERVLFLVLLESGHRYGPGSAQGSEAGVRSGMGSVHADLGISEGLGFLAQLLHFTHGETGSERNTDSMGSSELQTLSLELSSLRSAPAAPVLLGASNGFTWRLRIWTPALDFKLFCRFAVKCCACIYCCIRNNATCSGLKQ